LAAYGIPGALTRQRARPHPKRPGQTGEDVPKVVEVR
jgi:hypothetical protein